MTTRTQLDAARRIEYAEGDRPVPGNTSTWDVFKKFINLFKPSSKTKALKEFLAQAKKPRAPRGQATQTERPVGTREEEDCVIVDYKD